jgi:small subunit ribosomal protein S13
MARIAGIDLQDNWKVDYALTKIKGLSWALSRKIMTTLKLDMKKRIKDMTAEEISKISNELENYKVEGDLIREV